MADRNSPPPKEILSLADALKDDSDEEYQDLSVVVQKKDSTSKHATTTYVPATRPTVRYAKRPKPTHGATELVRKQFNQPHKRRAEEENTSTPEQGSFLEVSERVQTKLLQAHRSLSAITKAINSFGTRKDTPKLHADLHDMLVRTRQQTTDVQADLELLNSLGRERGLSRRERDARKIKQGRLSKDFAAFKQGFKKICALAKQKQDERNLKLSAEDDAVDDERQALLDDQPVKTMEYVGAEQELTFNHAVITERVGFVEKMQMEMADVEEMFQDLAFMVNDQGILINDLEKNIEVTKENTVNAHEELTRAAEYQRRKRTKMCCLLCLFVFIALAVVVLAKMIKHARFM